MTTDFTPSTELTVSSRSLISRFASPFKSKPRYVSDFYIRLDDPHRRYAPGDLVKGAVVLVLQKPLRITHITLCLHGFIKVYRYPIAPGEGLAKEGGFLGTGRGQRGTEYLGNGFASIFEDEFVLHGEARLGAATWTLGFEMEFPPENLPSSIDFERGTISYALTCTLTRPTTLNPTMTCDRKIYLIESVDIAAIRRPKPRIITLEPIPRRGRNKTASTKPLSRRNQPPSPSSQPVVLAEQTTAQTENIDLSPADDPPQSPVPSEVSSMSAVSSSNVSFRVESRSSIAGSNSGVDLRGSPTNPQNKTITASIELLRGGCLPGDVIPITISVDHTKPIKSLNGIIVTLYRQARVDQHPALPLGPARPGKAPQYEDYYPKSRTGLGGLSLSSAGSSHGFRMDLDQTFTPLIVDPDTLTAVVKTSVRVPENVFPTISNSPGGMISFAYFVEIIVDLRGKLGQDRFRPRFASKSAGGVQGYVETTTWRSIGLQEHYRLQNSNFADTDQIRRERSVVACSFELIMGTKDSARKGKRVDAPDTTASIGLTDGQNGWDDDIDGGGDDDAGDHDDAELTPRGYHEGDDYDETPDDENGRDDNPDSWPDYEQPPQMIPLPPSEEPLDEKARIRRAEEQLLPSAPPLPDEDDTPNNVSPSDGPAHSSIHPAPSAPHINDLYGEHHAFPDASPLYSAEAGPSSFYAAQPYHPPHPLSSEFEAAARRQDGMGLPSPSGVNGDDKQELERRRLMALASEPPPEEEEREVGEEDEQGQRKEAAGVVVGDVDTRGRDDEHTERITTGTSRNEAIEQTSSDTTIENTDENASSSVSPSASLPAASTPPNTLPQTQPPPQPRPSPTQIHTSPQDSRDIHNNEVETLPRYRK
ncbi:ph-response sensor protein [Agyrium rufum]|nr:ph-response sensor protein [Agyrium rufum]